MTRNVEHKAVLKGVADFEVTQEMPTLLKLLAQGNHEIEKGKAKPITDVVQRLRSKGVSNPDR